LPSFKGPLEGTKFRQSKQTEPKNNERVFEKDADVCTSGRSGALPPIHAGATLPRKSNTKWSDEDDQRLLDLRAAGKSVISIGLALRRSTDAIEGRIGVLRAKERLRMTAPDQSSVQK